MRSGALRIRTAALAVLLTACSETAQVASVASSASPRPKACSTFDDWDETCSYDPQIVDHIRKDLINFVYELNAYHGVWKKHQDLLSALWDQAGDESTYHDADQQMKALEIALTAEEIDAVPSIVRDPEPDYHEEDDHYLERLAASLAYLLKSPYWTPERWDVFEGKVALFAIRERMGLKAKLLCLRNWRNDFGNVWETGMAGQAYDGASCVDFFANEQREFPPAASAYETARSIYDYLTAFRYDAPWLPIVDECYLSNLDATDFWCKS